MLLCSVATIGLPALADGADLTPQASGQASSTPTDSEQVPEQITITASRLNLLGTAASASEGVVDDEELQLAPVYRPGQLFETVPGLIVTLHSGEGKANQFLMRGYNLDHGTDLATFVDDMPINQPTHAHGQGYTDLNFLIPELADQITYTKGPYYADVGDFGSVGSVQMGLKNIIPDEASSTAGSYGYQRLFTGTTEPLGHGDLLAALELQHYDGPFVVPDNARKVNAAFRYSQAGGDDSFSLTAMVYHQLWTSTTDIPIRAILEGIVPNRFGSLDPTDGGNAVRASFSADYESSAGVGRFMANAFYIFNELHLYNDFTHYLVDPIHGDQEVQFENRSVVGGAANYTLRLPQIAGIGNEVTAGAFTRYDILGVGRLPSEGQQPLVSQENIDPSSFSNDDRVDLFAAAAYLRVTTHWTDNFRSVFGFREDFQDGNDRDLLAALHETAGYTNGGNKSQFLPQPKASLIYGPASNLELYLSAGEGFHSADLRGVNQDRSVDLGLPRTPLLARQYGEEAGVRANILPTFAITLAGYNLWQQSEIILDPDVGQDTAGPPSDRYGFEVNASYEFRRWLEFYGSVSGNHSRFTQPFDDGTGHLGTYIADAPSFTGSAALYLRNLGPWSGGLQYRYLGNYPLSSGPCVDSAAVHDFPGVAMSCANAPTALGQVNGKGFGQLNLDAHYSLASGWGAALGIYNLLNTRAAAAEFWYVDRLKSEVDLYPDGRADIHEHPLEPLMVRFTLSKAFE
jgi:hypothetical protein